MAEQGLCHMLMLLQEQRLAQATSYAGGMRLSRFVKKWAGISMQTPKITTWLDFMRTGRRFAETRDFQNSVQL